MGSEGSPEAGRSGSGEPASGGGGEAAAGGGTERRPPGTRRFRTSFLRTFTIQGSWNYRTLLGAGLAYAMLPLLRYIHAGDPVGLRAAVRRHAAAFNGHPYLCGMAVTALARLEYEGTDPARLARFRTALSGPLGALGDRAIWAGWRPFALLLAISAYAVGWEAWKAALAFLVVFNGGHLWLRRWAFVRGWRDGIRVGSTLTGSPLRRVGAGLLAVDLGLLGLAVGLLTLGIPGAGTYGFGPPALALAAGLAGFLAPTAGRAAPALLAAAAIVGFV